MYTAGKGSFTLSRRVTIGHPSANDKAFSTRFTLHRVSRDLDAYDMLAPGVWYGRNEHVPKHAIAGDYSDRFIFMREDRLTSPFVMAQDRETGISLCVGDASPDARTFSGEDLLPRLVDERMQFGSLGVERTDGVSMGFLFPGSEGRRRTSRAAA